MGIEISASLWAPPSVVFRRRFVVSFSICRQGIIDVLAD